jgi:hypothetical protein
MVCQKKLKLSLAFDGIWIVDKDTGEVLVFDKAIGNVGTVESTFNQQRTQIDTFGSYPQFYYSNDSGYEVFSLSTVILLMTVNGQVRNIRIFLISLLKIIILKLLKWILEEFL